MENFIEYNLFFRVPLKANEDIVFNNFSEEYIEKVTIFKGEIEKNYPKRKMRIDFKSKKLTSDVLKNIDNFVLEFLHKLTLDMKTLFPFYEETSRKIENIFTLKDYINISDEVRSFDEISNNNIFIYENIKFSEYLEDYKKMIRILAIAESDPVTVFLILYDWFLSWVNVGNTKPKQKDVIEYIRNHKNELEKYYMFQFYYNEEKKYEEDDFTKLRNDIAHSYERINEDQFARIGKRARYLLKPLIYVMTDFLKNK